MNIISQPVDWTFVLSNVAALISLFVATFVFAWSKDKIQWRSTQKKYMISKKGEKRTLEQMRNNISATNSSAKQVVNRPKSVVGKDSGGGSGRVKK